MSQPDLERTPDDAPARTAEDATRERREIDALFRRIASWKEELKLDQPVVLSDEYLALVAEWERQAFSAGGASKSWVFRHDAEFKRYFRMVRESNHR